MTMPASASTDSLVHHVNRSPRHETAWIECGPADGPLMIFVHGWPELGILWRRQMQYFSHAGWRCIAPDMRGYGRSSIPTSTTAYTLCEIVADMIELHDALGADAAVWVGHDWGSPVVSSLAAHHANRCLAIVNISVPYLPDGFALSSIVPLVDRALYPLDAFPLGQWDYYAFYNEQFDQATKDFEADIRATFAAIFRRGSPNAVGQPSPTASVRAKGGRFGAAHRAPDIPRDESMMSEHDFDTFVRSFTSSGFRGTIAWYLNDEANIAFARSAPNAGRLTLPVLFLNGLWDPICDITRSASGDPMRKTCADLTVVSIEGGHWLPLECPDRVNDAIAKWLDEKQLVQRAKA